MAGIMLAMFIMGAVGGAASGGYNAYNQQAKINKNICDTKDAIAQYISTSNDEYLVYSDEYNKQKKQLQTLNNKIQLLNEDTKIAHSEFKKSYTFFLIGGISLIVLLIFIFFTKKVVLHETAMKK